MEKIQTALSNDVYRTNEDTIIKEYIWDDFKKAFGSQEDKGLINSDHTFNLLQNGIEMDYIEHTPWKNSEISIEENIKFIKWLKEFHKKSSIETLDYPGFESAYFGILNMPPGRFSKKIKYWLYEKGMIIDALKILYRQDKKVLLHNDLVEGNILKLPNGDFDLIDFEYCGVGNPIFDLASFLTERDLSFDDQTKIAKAYDSNINLDELWIVCAFLQAFWARWALYKFSTTQKPIYNEMASKKIQKFNELVK